MIHFEQEKDLEPISADTMTPMIDVILSLIAFMMLMINAPLLTMEMDLPDVEKSENTASSEKEMINLLILSEAHHWKINENLITSNQQLENELDRLVISAEEPVATILSIDQESSAQRMIDTLDILNRLGVKDTQIALENSAGKS